LSRIWDCGTRARRRLTIEQIVNTCKDFNFAGGPIEDRILAERFAYHAEETELSLMLFAAYGLLIRAIRTLEFRIEYAFADEDPFERNRRRPVLVARQQIHA